MPDPDAVRAALAEIDETDLALQVGDINFAEWADRVTRPLHPVTYAARAWLAEQDRKEASDAT